MTFNNEARHYETVDYKKAKVKAYEYAGGILIKRAAQVYYTGWTVTPTTNFNDYSPCTAHWDLTFEKEIEKFLVEGKARSEKYRINNPRIQDLQITAQKLDWVREASAELYLPAYIYGIYPYDGKIYVWDANKKYETCIIHSKDFEMDDENDEKKDRPGYTLYFKDRIFEMDVDGSDFDENFHRACQKYMRGGKRCQ